ncbi:archease [Streptomyces sp. CC210A]|uniref:archease n=1 Tax=Streptomyces sp. CC210A TaxID=2898184 RepID=UPI001F3D46C8|nr:archease [Streptomyces sp. CC210A]
MAAEPPVPGRPRDETAGHRTLPHSGDVRIEAWGETREQCLGEAVLGWVDCFADVSAARARVVRRVRVPEESDEDLLATLLEEVVFRFDVHGEVPVDVEVETADGDLDVRLAVADADAVPVTGTAPTSVSWSDLRMGRGPYGWTCGVTVADD